MPDYRFPETPAEKQAAREALAKARQLIDSGNSEVDAAGFATLACPEWEPLVSAILEGRESHWRVISTPTQAAETTRRTYGSRARQQCLARAERADTDAFL